MADQEHFDILKQGISVWNMWRMQHPEIIPDLNEAILAKTDLSATKISDLEFEAVLHGIQMPMDIRASDFRNINFSRAKLRNVKFYGIDLNGADLSGADLTEADLTEADLTRTNLSGANLNSAILISTNLTKANLYGAQLPYSNLSDANLSNANLNQVNLSGADLNETICFKTNLREARLTNCLVYGICVWNVQMESAEQKNLIITSQEEPTITSDNLKIAQFIHLLLNNEEIREVIDTITTKVILILGRFTDERKKVLDALREELRKRNYTPVLFDFEKPASRDLTETVSTLAHMARFVIADITDAKSIPQELLAIVPDLPSVPVQPLILNSQSEYSMFEHFTRYPWVLPVYRYTDEGSLLNSLKESIIEPAEKKAKELEKR